MVGAAGLSAYQSFGRWRVSAVCANALLGASEMNLKEAAAPMCSAQTYDATGSLVIQLVERGLRIAPIAAKLGNGAHLVRRIGDEHGVHVGTP